MKILNIKDNGVHDISDYKNRASKLGPMTHIDKSRNLSRLEWGRNGHIKAEDLYPFIDTANRYHQGTIDLLHCFVHPDNWQSEGIIGWKLGGRHDGCIIALTKYREDYDDTAMHELLHAVWSYIYIHTGINPEYAIGVSETGGIHGDAKGYEEYQYDKLIQKIKPLFQLAVGEDLSDEYRHVGERVVNLAKRYIRQLKRQEANEKVYG